MKAEFMHLQLSLAFPHFDLLKLDTKLLSKKKKNKLLDLAVILKGAQTWETLTLLLGKRKLLHGWKM